MAQKVLDRMPLKFNHTLLELKPLQPLPPPPTILGLTEPVLLQMTGLAPDTDPEHVKNFADPVVKCRLLDVMFGAKPGTALLKFDGTPCKQSCVNL